MPLLTWCRSCFNFSIISHRNQYFRSFILLFPLLLLSRAPKPSINDIITWRNEVGSREFAYIDHWYFAYSMHTYKHSQAELPRGNYCLISCCGNRREGKTDEKKTVTRKFEFYIIHLKELFITYFFIFRTLAVHFFPSCLIRFGQAKREREKFSQFLWPKPERKLEKAKKKRNEKLRKIEQEWEVVKCFSAKRTP